MDYLEGRKALMAERRMLVEQKSSYIKKYNKAFWSSISCTLASGACMFGSFYGLDKYQKFPEGLEGLVRIGILFGGIALGFMGIGKSSPMFRDHSEALNAESKIDKIDEYVALRDIENGRN